MVSCVVFCLGIALQTGASTFPTFVVGRLFAGCGVGLVSTLVPMYQSECSPRWIRGTVISSYQWAISIGILLASIVDNGTKDRHDHSAWRIPIAIQSIWAFVLFLGMSWLPETPRWLIMKGSDDAATTSLSRLTSLNEEHPVLQAELREIRATLAIERKTGQNSYRDCFRSAQNKVAFRTLTAISVLALQQLTGVVFIGSYGTTFFANVGIKNPFLVTVAVNVVQTGMTIHGMWGIEKLGRRPLLLGGAIVMSVSAYLIAILGVATSVGDVAPQRAVIALVCLYYAAYASTWAPVGWTLPNEIIPLSVRAKSMSLAVAIHWLCTWAVSFISPYLANSGPGDAGLGVKIFFIWGSTTSISGVFTYFCVPETKGLSLEQVDLLYRHSTPLLSTRYRCELLATSSSLLFQVDLENAAEAKEKVAMELINTSAHRTLVGVAMIIFSAFGGILLGYDTGTINGILQMQDWLRTFGNPVSEEYNIQPTVALFSVTTSVESLVVSILSAGTFLGALGGAPIGDAIGRRSGILVSCIVFCFGISLQTGATNLPTFIVGRFFAGFGVGLTSTLIPMYQSECAPKWIRGVVVSCYSLTITIGLLLASVINNSTKARSDHSAWRIPIAVQFIWVSVLFSGMMWLPETPRWLARNGERNAAAKSLSRLRLLSADDPQVQAELQEIFAALEQEDEMERGTYRDCFRFTRSRIALRTFSAIVLQALQQLTGITFIFYYGTTFFANAGIRNPFLVSVAVNVVNMGMTIPGIWGVDKFGRRPLLIWGAAIIVVTLYLVAILDVTTSVRDLATERAVIALVCVYIASFAATWGPIVWVITGEIFPLNIRAKGISLSAASHWIWNWAISFAAPYLVNRGTGNADLGVKVFFIWGTACAICALFTWFAIPETKGLSLEEIDNLYRGWKAFRHGSFHREPHIAVSQTMSVELGQKDHL
ncbi:general substrate transporter [Trametes maxima]|nr:general substrate transporter [Trametes maxima]